MLDLHQLSIFLAVAEAASYSGAAKQLHLTQPAVSQQVKAVEKQFGKKLFHRSGRKIELTEAGRNLLPAAKQLIDLARWTENYFVNIGKQNPLSERLVVGSSISTGEWLMPKLIGLFQKHYALSRIVLRMFDHPTVLKSIAEQETDIGMVGSRPRERGLQSVKFVQDELVLVVPHRHPWAKRLIIDAEEVLEASLILRDGSAGSHVFREALEKRGIPQEDLKVTMEIGSLTGIAWAVEAGLGIAVLPKWMASRFPRIKPVSIEGVPLFLDTYLVRSARRVPGAIQLHFWEFLQSPEVQRIIIQETQRTE
ncbi:MAG: LysR family transcriptional regulator [Chloroflexi bacterium]|nr:LysR family transcriptional regulator [Chloroflexota bacterium]